MEEGVAYTKLEPESDERFVPLRRRLGVSAFGLNQMVLLPGQRGRVHRHQRQEEVYLVLEGTLTLAFDGGEERELGPGDLARVAPDVRPQLVNRGDARCVIIGIGAAGEHQGRDGEAFEDWDRREGRPPQEVPLPPDLPR